MYSFSLFVCGMTYSDFGERFHVLCPIEKQKQILSKMIEQVINENPDQPFSCHERYAELVAESQKLDDLLSEHGSLEGN